MGMEIAKVTSKGQITIPVEIRKKLNLKNGDKVVFIEDQDKVFILNAAKAAFINLQKAFAGEAERAGIYSEEDVVNIVAEVREELKEKHNENND
jgi:antitoxin PrlF